jgi:hypothetical protein
MITVRFNQTAIRNAHMQLDEDEQAILNRALVSTWPEGCTIEVTPETEPILRKLGKMTTKAVNVAPDLPSANAGNSLFENDEAVERQQESLPEYLEYPD